MSFSACTEAGSTGLVVAAAAAAGAAVCACAPGRPTAAQCAPKSFFMVLSGLNSSYTNALASLSSSSFSGICSAATISSGSSSKAVQTTTKTITAWR